MQMVKFAHSRRRTDPNGSRNRWFLVLSSMGVLSHGLVALGAFRYGREMGCQQGSTAAAAAAGGVREENGSAKFSLVQKPASESRKLFPIDLDTMFSGGAIVPRDDFIKQHDIGVPWDEPVRGAKGVLLLYSSLASLPSGHIDRGGLSNFVQYKTTNEATTNCTTMKIVLTEPKQENVCIAIVPQWESFHVHHLMRLKPDSDTSDSPYILPSYPLRYVSRRHEITGKGLKYGPNFPEDSQTKRYWVMLIDYLQKLESSTNRLKPIAAKVAGKGNTVVVMVCNFGQSELLVNFVCSARARGLDLSTILLFATDSDVSELAKSLGIAVFDVNDAFGDMPKGAARAYGDQSFKDMMMSKVYCVHLVNSLGYDVLFQDVDVVWKRNALEYFHSPASGDFDFYFQDDGAHSNRYTPYSPNSGFYYIRNNKRTKYFFEVFIRMGELIVASGSHQSVMNGLLSEQASSTGLRVKVFQRDSELGRDFPGGYHYHKRKNFMKDVINGKRKPYIFHMSWTTNKENKRLFYQQLGEWFVNDECIGKTLNGIERKGDQDLSTICCTAKALVQCHYRDKPSKIPCKESPRIDYDGQSFW